MIEPAKPAVQAAAARPAATVPSMKVCVIDHFDSMHLLPGHPKCGVPHGHTYKLEVVAEGPVVNGMVIDFADLKGAMREIIRTFDHTNLNLLLEMPSCENICLEILKRLQQRLSHRLTVRVWEGDGKWAEASA
ncbi:MAG TPA: 6-carboxytetrahydropterin synthase [Planctomycetota bacterium]|nr:6-carboxytetrahydropterin synthase [Planctomycetota bacterium]